MVERDAVFTIAGTEIGPGRNLHSNWHRRFLVLFVGLVAAIGGFELAGIDGRHSTDARRVISADVPRPPPCEYMCPAKSITHDTFVRRADPPDLDWIRPGGR